MRDNLNGMPILRYSPNKRRIQMSNQTKQSEVVSEVVVEIRRWVGGKGEHVFQVMSVDMALRYQNLRKEILENAVSMGFGEATLWYSEKHNKALLQETPWDTAFQFYNVKGEELEIFLRDYDPEHQERYEEEKLKTFLELPRGSTGTGYWDRD